MLAFVSLLNSMARWFPKYRKLDPQIDFGETFGQLLLTFALFSAGVLVLRKPWKSIAKWFPKCCEINPKINLWVTFGPFPVTKSAHRLVMWASRSAGKTFRRQIGPGMRSGVRTYVFWSVFGWKCGSNGPLGDPQIDQKSQFWTKNIARRFVFL